FAKSESLFQSFPKDGSYLEKDWANDKEGFFQSLLSAAGITANGAVDAVGASQFFDALQALKQIQAGTAFTTAGSAGALTLAPTPAIPAYSAPLRFRVKFSQNSTGNDTINVSGKGAQSLKQYNSAGAKVAAVFAANQLADVEYDGVDFVLLDQLPSIADFLNTARINVASAATVNLTTSAPSTRNIALTGTTGITGFTVAANQLYFVTFLGALTITNSATLITQSNANIVTAVGDTCILRAISASVVEILCYTRGIPQAIGDGQTTQVTSKTAGVDYTNTTGRPILIAVYAIPTDQNTMNLVVDGVVVAQNTVNNATSGANSTLTWLILPGQVYRVNSSPVAIAKWTEIRV
uniref:hypothetical protein n=1 Tax=Pseudomonas veronii TaxID=76761 RepID=UPI0006990808